MNIGIRHAWKVSPREAMKIQEELRKNLVLRVSGTSWERIGAGDVAYSPTGDRIYAAFLAFSLPDLALLENAAVEGRVSFPYIPGLFAFREAPILIEGFSRLKTKPDLILVDGQGIAHPRSMGLASHLGLLLDLPAIGCAKSRLYGAGPDPSPEKGSTTPLMGEGRIVGMIVRTRSGVKPVYVSPGHRMDLENSVRIVLSLVRGYRTPEPLRQAHIMVNQLRKRGRNYFHRRRPGSFGHEL